jgi:hypothetical protein
MPELGSCIRYRPNCKIYRYFYDRRKVEIEALVNVPKDYLYTTLPVVVPYVATSEYCTVVPRVSILVNKKFLPGRCGNHRKLCKLH